MSKLGDFLSDLMQNERRQGENTTARALADRTRMKGAMISRIINGETKSMHRSTLERLVDNVSPDIVTQAKALRAYLLDQRVGRAAALVDVIVRTEDGARVKEDPVGQKTKTECLSNAAEEASLDTASVEALVKIIRGCAVSPRLRRNVRDLAEIAQHDILPKS